MEVGSSCVALLVLHRSHHGCSCRRHGRLHVILVHLRLLWFSSPSEQEIRPSQTKINRITSPMIDESSVVVQIYVQNPPYRCLETNDEEVNEGMGDVDRRHLPSPSTASIHSANWSGLRLCPRFFITVPRIEVGISPFRSLSYMLNASRISATCSSVNWNSCSSSA